MASFSREWGSGSSPRLKRLAAETRVRRLLAVLGLLEVDAILNSSMPRDLRCEHESECALLTDMDDNCSQSVVSVSYCIRRHVGVALVRLLKDD